MMKKTTGMILAGLLVAIVAITISLIPRGSLDAPTADPDIPSYPSGALGQSSKYQRMMDDRMIRAESIEEMIREIDLLTQEEKDQLIDDEREVARYYQKVNELTKQFQAIAEKIYQEHDHVFQERDRLMLEQDDLWQKLIDHTDEDTLSVTDNHQLIRSSKVLNEEEKNILLEREDRLKAIDHEITAIYDRIDLETAEMTRQIDDCIKEADAIHARSQHIWDKIHKNR